ncbi:MAG: hypothetical protein WAK84_10555 [Candidatus Cybelea sp.]
MRCEPQRAARFEIRAECLSFSRGISEASSYRVLHEFSGRDGAYPLASLIEVNGTLYGTTTGGVE